jgi:hypothetical protein
MRCAAAGADVSYDWFKEELIRMKVMTDGPALHFVASVGAVCYR